MELVFSDLESKFVPMIDYSSTILDLGIRWRLSGQLYALVTLSLGKETLLTIQ
jgi:hypothetical protein